MRHFLYLFLTSLLLSFTAGAQQTPLALLQRAFQTANTYQCISYSARTANKNIFDDKDTAFEKENATIYRDKRGNIVSQNSIQLNHLNRPVFRTVFFRDSLYSFDLTDSTYSIKAHSLHVPGIMTNYLEQLQYVINKKTEKIMQRKDTVINAVHCYSFFINSYDTVEDNSHNYTHLYFYIDKKTLLPVYLKQLGTGSAKKGGYSLGRITIFNETQFEKYDLQKKKDSSGLGVDLSGFDPENRIMLAEGSIAPEIQISDLNGKAIPDSVFENKIVLLEFGSTTCPANILTQPVLSRLSNSYHPEDVAIICIYSSETPDQVRSYIEANHIGFPIYLANSRLKKLFKTVGVPNFYLINKKGVIVKALEGYTDKLEEELITAIDSLKEK